MRESETMARAALISIGRLRPRTQFMIWFVAGWTNNRPAGETGWSSYSVLILLRDIGSINSAGL